MGLLAMTHVSSSQDKNCESHFWPKAMTKNGLYHFYPSAKSRRELKIKTSGVISRGASAYYVQNTAPPKQAVCRFSDNKISDDYFCQFFLPIFFRCRKMKCRGSCETRSPKVWGRTQPSSGGKRLFKVLQKSICLMLDVEKWNDGDRLKRVFPNFEADRSHVWRVNGCSKFPKIFEIRELGH